MKVSVVIPTYNRPHTLKKGLEALSKQSVSNADFEVIVVKDGREIPLDWDKLIENYNGLAVRFFEIDHAGPGAARNAGIGYATGDIICFTDDDCVPDRHWVANWVKYFVQHPNQVAAGGTVDSVPTTTFVEKYIALKGLLVGPAINSEGIVINLVTANAACRRSALKAIDGFANDYLVDDRMVGAEDLDFTYRLRQRFGNSTLGVCTEARVAHHHRQTLSAMIKQHIAYGKGALIFIRKFNLPPVHLGIKDPTILGLFQYIGYLIHRIATKSLAEFRRKRLPVYLYPVYGGLDFIRKFSYMWGFYLMNRSSRHGTK